MASTPLKHYVGQEVNPEAKAVYTLTSSPIVFRPLQQLLCYLAAGILADSLLALVRPIFSACSLFRQARVEYSYFFIQCD